MENWRGLILHFIISVGFDLTLQTIIQWTVHGLLAMISVQMLEMNLIEEEKMPVINVCWFKQYFIQISYTYL